MKREEIIKTAMFLMQNVNGRETPQELFQLGIEACLEVQDDLKHINIEPKRYFLVMYAFSGFQCGDGAGQISFTTGSNYLTQKKTIEIIKEKNNGKLESVVIKNIIELSESDYNDWVNTEL